MPKPDPTLARAWCFRSGHIAFGHGRVPNGAIPIIAVRMPLQTLIDKLSPRARLAYDGETLLVPGVPEADDDNEAFDAMMAWRDWATQDLRA